MPGHYSKHSGFSDFLGDVCWVQSIDGGTLQLLLKAILNSRTQFHSLADPLFQLYRTMCILLPNTHMHTQTMGGTVLIAFCTALKGWPPGFCSPSIGFIMVAVHPSSCCIIPETYFGFSWLLCEHSSAPSILNLSPCVHLSYYQRSLSHFRSTQRPASCLYTCPGGVSYITTVDVPCPPNISSLVNRWLMVSPPRQWHKLILC